jgi:hypothetical protein
MWVYNSANGVLFHNGKWVGTGYSGHPPYVNDVAAQGFADQGPIPQGQWTIGDAVDSPQLGEIAMPLTPNIGTVVFNRSGFWIHGDSLEFPGLEEASHGCIVMPRTVRLQISGGSGYLDKDLEVV